MATIEREEDILTVIDVGEIVVVEPAVLTVTPLAAQTFHGLLKEKGFTDHGMRVFVAGGGCSGMQYGMQFEANPQPTDKIVEVGGVKFIVDPSSLPYLQGATIDYVDNLMGGGFRIDNPNAVSSCGCGTSFRTEGSAEPQSSGAGCDC